MSTITLTTAAMRTTTASTTAKTLSPQDVRIASSSAANSFERIPAPDDNDFFADDPQANQHLFADSRVSLRRGSGRGEKERGFGGAGPSTSSNIDLDPAPYEPTEGELHGEVGEGATDADVPPETDEQLMERNAELVANNQKLVDHRQQLEEDVRVWHTKRQEEENKAA